MSSKRSFLNELERFYLDVWRNCRSSRSSIRKMSECISKFINESSSPSIKDLIKDYGNRYFNNNKLILVDLGKAPPAPYPKLRQFAPQQQHVIENNVEAVILGITNKPGKGYWMYLYLPVYASFVVIKIRKMHEKISNNVGKCVKFSINGGRIRIFIPLNKAYRDNPKFSIHEQSNVIEIHCNDLKDIQAFRRGLIDPYRVIEVPIMDKDGMLKPSMGFIVILNAKRLEIKQQGNIIVLKNHEGSILLNRDYFHDEGGSCIAALLFKGRQQVGGQEVDGYALSSFECKCLQYNYEPYIPSNLLINVSAEKAVSLLKEINKEVFKNFRDFLRMQGIDAGPQGNKSTREVLIDILTKRGQAVKVPNIDLIREYEEAGAWLKYVKEKGFNAFKGAVP